MFERTLLPELRQELAHMPAVALLGPRQTGKTTLAFELARSLPRLPDQPDQPGPFLYLDLESERDRARLGEAELYLSGHLDKLVILDEVHRVPSLFPLLRGLIDQARRDGRRHGLYLLLGSASLDLLAQSGETLAGRIAYLELAPLTVRETGSVASDRLWLRGGFPDSLGADDDAASLRWRRNFIRTYLERDIPQFGPRIAAAMLQRLWTMLAHHQGGLLNMAQFARNLGVDVKTVQGYIDLLEDLLLLRRLTPWHANLGKRLVKSPKIYVRDSGLVHALLGIESHDALLSHPVIGASWEGHVIENLLSCSPRGTQGHFYRSSGGAEVDLLLQRPDGTLWAVEVKRSLSPKVERGFHAACDDLQPQRRLVVYPGDQRYPLAQGVEVMPLADLCRELDREG